MKANYSKLSTKLVGILGVTSVSLLMNLPSQAKEALNPHPNIFSEATHNGSQGIQVNSQSTDAEMVVETLKGNIKRKPVVAQKGGRILNPRPSIFNEPPYNRGRVPGNTQPVTPSRPATPTPPAAETGAAKNLVALVESNNSLKILAKALKAAGLVEVLQGEGPFTIFAPTDAAFAKLPQDALQDLLKPENKEVLVKVLTYHVVSGKVLSSDLKSGQVTSLQGDPITVKVDPATGVMVNDAKVIKADIQGSNGVIHQIDNLILPPSL